MNKSNQAWIFHGDRRPDENGPCVLAFRAADGVIDRINPACVNSAWPYWMPLPPKPNQQNQVKTIDSAPYKIEAVWYLPELRRESRRGQGWKDLHRDFEQLGHQSPAAIYVDVNYRDE